MEGGGEDGGVTLEGVCGGGGGIMDVLRARTGWGWVGWEVEIEGR